MIAAPLDQLHDVWSPAPVSWMPQTPAWYVFFTVIAAGLAWWAFRALRQWRRNWYRRAALRELATCNAVQVSELLKRTALLAWPRRKVASLSGEGWLRFLDQTARGKAFEQGAGIALGDLQYRSSSSAADTETLKRLAAEWIRRHHVSP